MTFKTLAAVSYSASKATMAVPVAVCELFSVKACDLGNWLSSRSRSLKMASFDRPYATFYWSSFFDIEYYRDLEIGVRGHSLSLKLVPFDRLGAVSYSPSIVTVAASVAICEIFSVKEWRDPENQVRGRSKSLKMAPFDRPYATFCWSAIVNIALSCTILELFDVE